MPLKSEEVCEVRLCFTDGTTEVVEINKTVRRLLLVQSLKRKGAAEANIGSDDVVELRGINRACRDQVIDLIREAVGATPLA